MKIINSNQKGFSLIELLVSIVLGLIIILAVGNIFLASRKTMNTTDALARTHESVRISFEMMARDLREAGGNPCSSHVPLGNKLNSRTGVWWQEFSQGVRGYEAGVSSPGTENGSSHGQRIANTDAIDVHSAFVGDVNVVADMPNGSSPIQVEANHGIESGDIALVCDTSAAFIFKVSNANPSGGIWHEQQSGPSNNCSNVFSYDDPCNNAATGYIFETDAIVSRTRSVRWYVGGNDDGQRSLFRAVLQNNEASASPTIVELTEVANNVNGLELDYFTTDSNDYIPASSVTDWNNVSSVRVRLEVLADMGNQRDIGVGNDGSSFTRSITHVVSLRNRQ